MAKGSNPADAHRKQLKKKVLAKNKEQRKKTREISTVKKDTRSLEADIRKLSSKGSLSAADKAELAALQAELVHITKAKQDYVEAHPEHRKFVFPDRAAASTSGSGSSEVEPQGLYNRDGKLKHPERSVYYDPVFNPFGAPPPGMPYREKPPTPEEMAAFRPVGEPEPDESDEDDDEDDEIEMPAGPPPVPKDDDSSSDDGSDDDIAMPVGPPPPKPSLPSHRVHISRPKTSHPQFAHPRPPVRHPQPFHPDPHMRHPTPSSRPSHSLPPNLTHLIDPLNATAPPAQTYQVHQASRAYPAPPPGPPSSQPPPPPAGPFFAPGPGAPTATISSAPVLRDLKAEAVAFVPAAIRRKKAAAPVASLMQINAAPTSSREQVGQQEEEQPREARVSLMGALRGVGIGDDGVAAIKVDKGKEDYQRFQREMQGFL